MMRVNRPSILRFKGHGWEGALDDERADLMFGIEGLTHARPRYDQAQTYYDGKVPEVFTSVRLRRALAAHNIDFDLNFAKTPVNAVTNRLKIASITSPDEQPNTLISQFWRGKQTTLEIGCLL